MALVVAARTSGFSVEEVRIVQKVKPGATERIVCRLCGISYFGCRLVAFNRFSVL